MKRWAWWFLGAGVLVLSGFLILNWRLDQAPRLSGSAERGERLFAEHRCQRCHTLEGRRQAEEDLPGRAVIHLGGEEHMGWSAPAFAQAIVDPSHSIAGEYSKARLEVGDIAGAKESPMPDWKAVLSEEDLSHLAAFLEEL